MLLVNGVIYFSSEKIEISMKKKGNFDFNDSNFFFKIVKSNMIGRNRIFQSTFFIPIF